MALSFAEASRAGTLTRARDHSGSGAISPVLVAVLGSLASFALSWAHLVEVWRTGTFFDTDDAMRMVQVRAWMAGQAWFDLTVHRLAPPAGLLMHWSRVVDVPLAVLIRFFAVFTDPVSAERLTRIVFPLGLQIGLIAAAGYTARVLVGRDGALPATLLVVTSGFEYGQFVAGRVDHHAPQITLLVLMAGLTADILLNRRPARAVILALCIAVSLAISLENLPFMAVMIAALGLAWVSEGLAFGPVMRSFGLSLGACAAALFAATVPPTHYGMAVSDAFSLPHLIAAELGGLAFAFLPVVGRRIPTKFGRAMALATAAAAVATVTVGACPTILASPYASIDPVVRAVWLSHVTEAAPLVIAIRLHPQVVTLILCPLFAGLAAMTVAVWQEQGRARGCWILLHALSLVGLAGAIWEVRVAASATPLALLGGLWVFKRMRAYVQTKEWSPVLASGSGLLLLLPFAPITWIFVPVASEAAEVAASLREAAGCRTSSNLAPLTDLAPGTVFAPIDSGSHLLAQTKLAVLGAPYHRNNQANRTVIDGFTADPALAESIVKTSGARYVALCPGQVQAAALRDRNPNGLAARLLAGEVPPWLVPLPIAGTSYRVFAIR